MRPLRQDQYHPEASAVKLAMPVGGFRSERASRYERQCIPYTSQFLVDGVPGNVQMWAETDPISGRVIVQPPQVFAVITVG